MTAPPVAPPVPANQPPPANDPNLSRTNDGGGLNPPPPSSTTTIVGERERLILSELKRLEEENRKLSERFEASQKPPVDTDKINKEFWNNPHAVLKGMLDEAIKPLKDTADGLKAESNYDKLKVKYRNDPKFRDFLAQPGVESHIDSLMANQEPTEKNLIGTILGVKGAMELGFIDKPVGSQPPPTGNQPPPSGQPPMPPLPPHMRPSAPPAPSDNPSKKPVRELTENERRLARENNLTPEQYVELMDIHPADVVTYKGDKPEPKK